MQGHEWGCDRGLLLCTEVSPLPASHTISHTTGSDGSYSKERGEFITTGCMNCATDI